MLLIIACSLWSARRKRFGALAHATLERLVQLAQLLLGAAALGHFGEQRAVGQRDLAVLAMQLGEHGDLRAEDRRVHRLVQVVDRAAAVAFEHVLVLVVVGGEEDDRHAGGLLALLDHLRQLEAGHAGHADVQDEQGEFLADEREQRLVGGLRAHQPVARVVEDGLEHGQVLRLVVDDQDVDRRVDEVVSTASRRRRRCRCRQLRGRCRGHRASWCVLSGTATRASATAAGRY